MNEAWLQTIGRILSEGRYVTPRNQATLEVLHHTLRVPMRRPVLTVPARALGYRFLAAEAYWILSGDDRVATIAPYSKTISQYSDNGATFAGAYGPRIVEQLDYVVDTLTKDHDTRQAVIEIWRPNPPQSRDVPCTLSFQFLLRSFNKLHVIATMRSSDAWLGLPYDAFNFSMLGHLVAGHLYQAGLAVVPGTLFMALGSSHLYQRDVPGAERCIREHDWTPQAPVPEDLARDPRLLLNALSALREPEGAELRWWNHATVT